MNDPLGHEIVARFHAASMRRIAQELADQPRQSAAGARAGRARSYRRDDAGVAPSRGTPRQPTGRIRKGDH